MIKVILQDQDHSRPGMVRILLKEDLLQLGGQIKSFGQEKVEAKSDPQNPKSMLKVLKEEKQLEEGEDNAKSKWTKTLVR